MPYITKADDIKAKIDQYAGAEILWLDTEIADFQTRNPRLSLIQLLDYAGDRTSESRLETLGERVSILDVLDRPEIADYFIAQIMLNPAIEKVFHNANYDLKYLGKTKAKNVTCTWEMAKKIPHYILPLSNHSLKTLAETLCNVSEVDKTQQDSDWGQRPLTAAQLNYAKMDPVYLAMVHHQLLQLEQISNPDPAFEDIELLAEQYLELKQQLQVLSSAFEHIETRLKIAMQTQNISQSNDLKLSASIRKTTKVNFAELAKVSQESGVGLNFPITLTQKLQKQLGDIITQLALQVETTTSWRLSVKESEDAGKQDELEF